MKNKRNYIIEFYRQFKKPLKKRLMYSDVDLQIISQEPKSIVRIIEKRAENKRITINWYDLSAEAHEKAFTVAKILSADILQEIADGIRDGLKEKWTTKEFVEKMMERLEAKGFTGLKPHRLKLIFDMNVRKAYAMKQMERLKAVKDIYPNWKYLQVQRKTKRLSHSKFHNRIFKNDDPIWNVIYPPSAFGCACSVVPLRDSDNIKISDGKEFFDVIKENADRDFNTPISQELTEVVKKWANEISRDYKKLIDKYKEIVVKKEKEKIKEEIKNYEEKRKFKFDKGRPIIDIENYKECNKYLFSNKDVILERFRKSIKKNDDMNVELEFDYENGVCRDWGLFAIDFFARFYQIDLTRLEGFKKVKILFTDKEDYGESAGFVQIIKVSDSECLMKVVTTTKKARETSAFSGIQAAFHEMVHCVDILNRVSNNLLILHSFKLEGKTEKDSEDYLYERYREILINNPDDGGFFAQYGATNRREFYAVCLSTGDINISEFKNDELIEIVKKVKKLWFDYFGKKKK